MQVFQTEDPCDYRMTQLFRIAELKEGATIADDMRDVWPQMAQVVAIAAESTNQKETEFRAMELAGALSQAGLGIEELRVLEDYTKDEAEGYFDWADVLMLLDGENDDRADFFPAMRVAEQIAAHADRYAVIVSFDAAATEAAGIAADQVKICTC